MGNAPENKGVFVKKGNYRINGGLLKSRFQAQGEAEFHCGKVPRDWKYLSQG